MVQDWDSGVLDTNDEWRSRSVAGTRKQVRSSGRNDAANNERTKDVEEHESVDESVCSFGNVAARGLGFASRDGDEFGRHDKGKGRTNHGVPKTAESSGGASDDIFFKGIMFPIPKSKTVMSRCAAKKDDNAENNETADCNDLD